MARQKLKKFADNKSRTNILEPDKPLYDTIKGNWNSFFENQNDLVLELACGRGEYSTGLAPFFPEKNFIGIDVKGDRLWFGSNVAIEQNLKNVAFLRGEILQLEKFFEVEEVSEIWITFPDPRPKIRDEKRRVTHSRFLNLYKKLLKKNGLIHLKTDNKPLFDFTLDVLKDYKIKDLVYTHDLYSSPLLEEHFGIQTKYEKKFMKEGFTINYLKFRFE